jgi:hypothetical protein
MVPTSIDRTRQVEELKNEILAVLSELREEAIDVFELAYELKINLSKLFFWKSETFGD